MGAIMPPEKLRALLALTRREPLSVAVAITADEEGVLLLNKTAKPKKVLAQLKAEASKAKATLNGATTRFGLAQIDQDYDPTILKIAVNKGAPDKLRLKLNQLVKQFALKAVEFTVDPTLEEEPEDSAEPQPTVAGPAPGTAPVTAEQQTAPLPDPAAITAELQALIKRLPSGGARRVEAQALAVRAGTALKFKDVTEAARVLALLRSALDTAADQAPGGAPDPADNARLQSYDKARRLWAGTLKAVDTELLRLTAAIKVAYDPEGIGDPVAAAFTAQSRPVLGRFDGGLAAAIQAVIEADSGQRAEALGKARGIVAGLQAELAATPLLGLLDANPIAPVAIGRSISAALVGIARTLA
jgi:hypothetical protein